MENDTEKRVRWSFWIIGVVALVWNAMGCINFVMQMNPATLAAMPESHRAIAETRPMWASAAFAIAVFGGVLGGILLLLRKGAAYPAFVVSLVAVVVTMIHALGMSGAANKFGPFEFVLGFVLPVIVGASLVWYSGWARTRGWAG